MGDNLLTNGGFEADWGDEESHDVLIIPVESEPYRTEKGEFHTPPGWLSWFFHDPETWDQPEVGDIRWQHVPYRVIEGEKAAKLFTFYRKHLAGFLQTVTVFPGVKVRLSAQAHAWSNHPIEGHEACKDDGRCSVGVGRGGAFYYAEDLPEGGDSWSDGVRNFSFRLGIDPTGGQDPFSENVVWGREAYIYNEYHSVPPVEVVADGSKVTVFLRSKTEWAFKHNDAYWDDVRLEIVGDGPPPPPPPSSEYAYPVIERGSKVGVHAIYSDGVPGFAQELALHGARFPVIKAVDDFGWLQEVHETLPGAIYVARRTWPGDEGCGGVETWSQEQMRTHANQAINRIQAAIVLNPWLEDVVSYWEPVNEPDPPGPEGYRALSELMILMMDGAESVGLKLALFSLNAGTPEWDEMQAMVETGVFARARQGGHILALHEGTFESHDAMQYYGDLIPGAPRVPGAGALNFRYRYLYHLLEDRGEVVPLVVSEWYCGDEQSASTFNLLSAAQWYDANFCSDYYTLGFCPFTLGPCSGWGHTDWERVYEDGLVWHMIETKGAENELPPGESPPPPPPPPTPGDCVPPREQYQRTYVLLPQMTGWETMIWRACVSVVCPEALLTLGHSADDAGVGPLDRTVIAINPKEWGDDLQAFYDEWYPGAEMIEIEAATPYDAALQLIPLVDGDGFMNLSQKDGDWGDWDFGERAGGTLREFGCYLTSFAMMLRKLTGRDVRPPELDMLLRIAQSVYYEDNFAGLSTIPGLFAAIFDEAKVSNRVWSPEELGALLTDGWEVIWPRADFGHFVYLMDVDLESGEVVIIDAWDGELKRKPASWGKGIRALHVRDDYANGGDPPPPPPPPDEPLLIGIHDEGGAQWMLDQGLQGCSLFHRQLQYDPIDLDLRRFQEAGLTTIVRLNWGYADGTGTLPPIVHSDRFVDVVIETMRRSRGVDFFHVGNEPNNRGEWPAGHKLDPGYVVGIYNDIWDEASGFAKMGPPPLDPYFGPGSDNREWWRTILANIRGADALFLHCKTQTNNPDEVWSYEKFGDWPLQWQYLHLRTAETSLVEIPDRFANLPVFVTEVNPQHLQVSGGAVGWVDGNARWIHESAGYFRTLPPVRGIVYYRYDRAGDQAPFGLEGRGAILEAIAEEARRAT